MATMRVEPSLSRKLVPRVLIGVVGKYSPDRIFGTSTDRTRHAVPMRIAGRMPCSHALRCVRLAVTSICSSTDAASTSKASAWTCAALICHCPDV